MRLIVSVVLSSLLFVCITSAQQKTNTPNTCPTGICFIQNTNGLGNYQQSNASFNIDGSGTAGGSLTANNVNALNVTTNQAYQITGIGVLGIGQPSDGNLFVGSGAGVSNILGSGHGNVFVGHQAGYSNTTGVNNVFTGDQAGYSSSGIGNVYVGFNAGYFDQQGYQNTVVGNYAGYSNASGQNNTFLGSTAGYNNKTGIDNVFIGKMAGNYNIAGSNDIYIANNGPVSGNEDDTIRVGSDQHVATFIAGIYGVNVGGVPVQINADGQLGTASSSRRFKEQIQDMANSTNNLMKLRPVTFLYKPEYAKDDHTLQYGLIAEEVAEVYPDLVAYDKDGQPYSVRYQYFTTMLLNEVQKQYRRAEAEAKVITAQEDKIEQLEQRLTRLEGLVRAQVQTVAQEKE